jgi:hypothetical protein
MNSNDYSGRQAAAEKKDSLGVIGNQAGGSPERCESFERGKT